MEVTCPECSATLSLPDHAAGKKAKCPRCETVFVVPESSVRESEALQIEEAYFKPDRHDSVACPGCERWLAYTPDIAGQMVICPSCGQRSRMPAVTMRQPDLRMSQPSTIAADAPWSTTARTTQELNPYAQPSSPQSTVPSTFSRSVPNFDAPGWIMMITAGLTGLYYLGMSCVMAIGLLAANANAQDFAVMLIQVTAMILGLVMQCVIFAGGLGMTQRRNLTLARTAAILAIIPCLGCCFIQMPVGIWATIVLFNSEAQQHFES